MTTWEYHVEQFQIIDRWSGKRQVEEMANFIAQLDQLGANGWEMIGYEPLMMKGGVTGKLRGHMHVCFFKREAQRH